MNANIKIFTLETRVSGTSSKHTKQKRKPVILHSRFFYVSESNADADADANQDL